MEEGEAYVAMDRECDRSLSEAVHVLAMRSPSYFAGDLRKLKLVDYETLEKRAHAQQALYNGRALHHFFLKLRYGLVLSTKGLKSEAQKMSGGDYDGDKAWVCWNQNIVDEVMDLDAENTTTEHFQIKKSPEEQKPNSEASVEDRLNYALNFRKHQHQLGSLSNLLDRVIDIYGLGSEEADAVGTQAFLQVRTAFCGLVPAGIIGHLHTRLKGGSPILPLQGTRHDDRKN